MNTSSSAKSNKTCGIWLAQATTQLAAAGIGTARLDAQVLLEDTTLIDRARSLAHPEIPISARDWEELEQKLTRRCKHEPLAYIRGKTEFYGRNFLVTPAVLEPRPESETMIDLVKSQAQPEALIVDVGTGSGALAITTKLEMPKTTVWATDISKDCLKIAKQNAAYHKATISFYHGDLLAAVNLPTNQHVNLLCNLPYVPTSFAINEAAAMEPAEAIFGGTDGLDLYRTLFHALLKSSANIDFIYTESLPFQHKQLLELAAKTGFRLISEHDFIQVFTSYVSSNQSEQQPRQP